MEIMMSTALVPMVLSGEKTQTRRIGARWLKVKPGDVLAMREAFALNPLPVHPVLYRADHGVSAQSHGWTPAVHMPIHLVRVQLHVARVWQERADDISEQDAIAEGMGALTVEGLLEMAGGSKRKVLVAWQGSLISSRVWECFAERDWPSMTAAERFRLVAGVLGAKPDTMVTCIEFKAVRT